MTRYEVEIKDVTTEYIFCPNCGMEHKLKLTIQELCLRYIPICVNCFDREPQVRGCMKLFEYFVYNDKLVVRDAGYERQSFNGI